MNTGRVPPTPADTAWVRRSCSSMLRGPGMAVTRRRSWGNVGPPVVTAKSRLMRFSLGDEGRGSRNRVRGKGAGRDLASVRDRDLFGPMGDAIRRLAAPPTPEFVVVPPSDFATGAREPVSLRLMQPSAAPAPIPFWIAGRPATSDVVAEVVNPFDGSVVGRHAVPTRRPRRAGCRSGLGGAPRDRSPARRCPRRGAHARVHERHAASRGDRAPHHRRERQAAHVGPGRDPSRGLDVPLGRRGGPALQRRVPAPGHRPCSCGQGGTCPPVPDRAGARASRRSTSR